MALTETATDANKALVRRAIGYNHGAAEAATDIFSPDFVAYMPGPPPIGAPPPLIGAPPLRRPLAEPAPMPEGPMPGAEAPGPGLSDIGSPKAHRWLVKMASGPTMYW